MRSGKLIKKESWRNTDYDGSLVIMKKGTTQKIRVTSQANKSNDFVLTTFTKDELLHAIHF